MNNEFKTGYPHIDKPWLKYYTEDQKEIIIPDVNIVDYIKNKNKNNLSKTAETYYGKDFSYDEVLAKSDLAARALNQVGIKKQEVVANFIPNIPEAGQIWFGLTNLGAIADYIDPRPDGMDKNINSKKVIDILKYENVKSIVALDFCYLEMLKPIENELKDLGIETIILVSNDDSLSFKGKVDYLNDLLKYNKLSNSRLDKSRQISSYKALSNGLKMQKAMKESLDVAIKSSVIRVIKYKDLIKECENSRYEKISDSSLVNYIGHTSGTSGKMPKPIAHTNYSGIALSEQCEKAEFSSKKDETAFHLLPFFAPAGAYSNYLVNLATGSKLIDVAEFHLGDFGYLVKKYKPNNILATPSWLTSLVNYELLTKEDLEYLKKVIYVGEVMSIEKINEFQNWLRTHNSKAILESAHGMSELGGCGSYGHNEYNLKGSVGIPLPNTIYSLVNPNVEDHLEPLKFEEDMDKLEGELIISCPNITTGKLQDNVIVPHYELDGNTYIRTNDIVEMNRDGIFRHNDRKDRSFARIDGYKIKPYEIEKIIEKNKYVKDVKIVSYYDERKNGLMPMCHIILKDNFKYIDEIEIVNNIIYKTIMEEPNMSSRQIPSKFKFRDEFPITKNNKVDFVGLTNEKLDGTEICVDIEETNLSVGEIKIYKNGEKVLKLK